ncbi:MAG: PSD1 domain-containing protein [Pirellulales bacterium]|nr:PSD1 domain-containing protein [Pirellulales bacterium]
MQQATPPAWNCRLRGALVLGAALLCWLFGLYPRLPLAAATPAISAEAIEFFESRIRPVLAEHCYECHSAQLDAPKGELRLDSAAALLVGGQSGPVVVAGKPAESLLLSALKYESYEMPPQGKLPEAVIADFEQWIAMGAPDPRTADAPRRSASADLSTPANPRDHWSLQKPHKPSAPPVADGQWTRSVIDAFVLAPLEDQGLAPSVEAEPRILLRRLCFDLAGLPPTAEELDTFRSRYSDAQYEQAVDRLLASPRFGERWGRYWLDIARYADTKGYVFQEDRNYPHAYKYRDWVIAAFNGDMAFDRFIVNQIAADQTGDPAAAPAQGFLTLGRRFLNAAPDINDDRIDLLCRGLMGLTVACARCHDHKYDAIPTIDYYALYGVLASSTEAAQEDNPPKLVDAATPVQQHVFLRGNASALGPPAPRQFLLCLSEGEPLPLKNGSGRLDLAHAIASRDNPLTARVWVNRIWGKLFGRPLVATASDFGVRGDPPSHPELLDWLACTFMDEGWSTKRLIRRIVLSSAYRQSSDPRDDCAAKDSSNALLARMNRRRLDLEAVRDGLLSAAGRLDLTMGGPSVQLTEAPYPTRRAVYGFIERQNLPAFFRTFDFANPNTPAATRPQTASPHQALFMMNSPFALEQSRLLAERSSAAADTAAPLDDAQRIKRLYQYTLGRTPTTEELNEAAAFIISGQSHDKAAQLADAPRWQYGWGAYDPLSDRVEFHPFPHFAGNAWQGGSALPDAALGWAMLNVEGGHPGDAGHQTIRRWTAPSDGTLEIAGELNHPSEQGNGVLARVVAASRGKLGEWQAAHRAILTAVASVPVAAGEPVDLIVDSQGDVNFDSFVWRTTLRLHRADGSVESWNSFDGIDGQMAPPEPFDRWSQLAQVLLMSNEFMFVD